jgi:hypothetical protein
MNNESKQEAQYVMKAKKIYTMDEESPSADWVLVEGKRIKAVGNGEAPTGYLVREFEDAVVFPGLIDTHVHAGTTAVMLSGVNLIEVTCVQEALDLIEERCRTTEDDIVFAAFYIEPQINEGRFPTKKELDRISNGKKVMVTSITLHSSSVNTETFQALGFSEDLPGLGKDENGEFNGLLGIDEVQLKALNILMGLISEERYLQYIEDFGKMAVENGLTTVHCLEGQFVKEDKDLDIWMEKIDSGDLPFHCVLYPQLWDYERAKKYNLPRHGGCLTLDGADMDFTMALDEPYTCKPEVRGDLINKDSDVYQLVKRAHMDEKQCAFHAMGERAIDQVLDAYRRVIAEQGDKKLRHRIEHFTLPRLSHIELAAKLGCVVCQQPEYSYLFDTPGGPVEQWFGVERASTRFEHYKMVKDSGVVVAGGSDAPVNSLNPLTGIHGLVNARYDIRRMSVTEALETYTRCGAYAAFEEEERGQISEGYYADFTVLAEDPYEIPEKINEIEIVATISEGREVYRKQK